MSSSVEVAREDAVDRVLSACGGGRTLHVGLEAAGHARAFRRRAVEAQVWDAPSAQISDTQSPQAAPPPLPFTDSSFDLVCAYGVLDGLPDAGRAAMFDELLRVTRGPVLIHASGHSRAWWEAECLKHECRKHPLHQVLVPYEGLDWVPEPHVLLFERLPEQLEVGQSLAELADARDLHMDMLREGGRRADAHVGRYMLARSFVRPGDRVLDAACGLGYGSAILADGTLAEFVLGLDVDEGAIRYATSHYARSRTRLSFGARDLSTLGQLPAGSFDIIVSFETVEHLAEPDAFLAACRRLLTPAGRIICSVPNEWLDERGVDPNPHHLHVFNRAKLEDLCRRHFLIERVYGQTAGGGMKLPNAGRAIWAAKPGAGDAEWWLLTGMKDPAEEPRPTFRHGCLEHPEDDRTHALAFERDYDNPWLVRAMVMIGQRATSADMLDELAMRTLATADPASADTGAALCVRVYRLLDRDRGCDTGLLDEIERYCGAAALVPHTRRWQISLRYAEALYRLNGGDVEGGACALETCAAADALTFSPLLATKTVGAAFLRGWLAAQSRDLDTARKYWQRGISLAQRALQTPWSEIMLSERSPAIFGLREAALVVDLASQCATGLHLLPHALERPGILAAQLFESLDGRATRESRRARALEDHARTLQQRLAKAEDIHSAYWQKLDRVRATVLLSSTDDPLPPGLRVAIFGTGQGGRDALASLTARGADVRCFADNNASRHGTTIDGILVIDPATLPGREIDLIAVASVPGRYPIFAQLESMGYTRGRDFDAV